MSRWDNSTQGANARLHKSDLPEHGLVIVNSADPNFEADVRQWLGGTNPDSQKLANKLKQFSVFMRNGSDRDVLAYKLNWEIRMADGTVMNYPRQYFASDYLMGVQRSEQYDQLMKSVKRSGKRFFTIIPTPLETSSGTGQIRLDAGEAEKFQRSGAAPDLDSLVTKLTTQLSQATDITVSIQGALFEDGAYVGSGREADDEYLKLKAYVSAKYDLLREMKSSLDEGISSGDEVLDNAVGIAHQDVPIPAPNSDYEAYYNYFRNFHAREVESVRKAVGNDEKALKICLRHVDRQWIIPHRINGK